MTFALANCGRWRDAEGSQGSDDLELAFSTTVCRCKRHVRPAIH
jgi:hypothetical protein